MHLKDLAHVLVIHRSCRANIKKSDCLLLIAVISLTVLALKLWYFVSATVSINEKKNAILQAPSDWDTCYDRPSIENIIQMYEGFKFHSVGSTDLFVFSAYGDNRIGKSIRFVGMGTHEDHSGLMCLLVQDNKIYEFEAEVQHLPEGKGLKYNAVFINCESTLTFKPNSFVGLTNRSCFHFDFFLPLEILPPRSFWSYFSGISLCVPPIHSRFNNVFRLVEFIELNRLLGFRKFVFYTFSIGPDIRKVLQKYVDEELALVIPWEFPLSTGPSSPKYYQMYNFGQMVAIQDCLFRTMNRPHRYVAFHELDEFMIPKRGKTLFPLIRLFMTITWNAAGLSFRRVLFDLHDLPDDAGPLTSLSLTKRDSYVFYLEDKSRVLVDGNQISVMGIHRVWNYTYGNRTTVSMSELDGFVHKYRRRSIVTDVTALRYGPELKKNFNAFLRRPRLQ